MSTGPQGPQGPQGYQGPRGLQGLRGPTGVAHGSTGPAYGPTSATLTVVTASSSIYLTPQNFGTYFNVTSNSAGNVISLYLPFYNVYYPPGWDPQDPYSSTKPRPTEIINEVFPDPFWYGKFWVIKNNYLSSGAPGSITINVQTSTGALYYNGGNTSSFTLPAKGILRIIYTSNGYIGA